MYTAHLDCVTCSQQVPESMENMPEFTSSAMHFQMSYSLHTAELTEEQSHCREEENHCDPLLPIKPHQRPRRRSKAGGSVYRINPETTD